MRKLIVAFIGLLIIFLIVIFIVYNINEDIKAIKSAKVEIKDVGVDEIALLKGYIKLGIKIKIINDEEREIKDLTGNLNVYILDVKIGEINFEKVSVPPKAFKYINASINLYYNEIAESVIEAVKHLKFSMSIKGKIVGKVFFGLIEYEKPVEAYYSYG